MKRQRTDNGEQGTESGAIRMAKLLRAAVAPIDEQDEPTHDLWPAMLRRLDEQTVPRHRAIPWFDWALAGGLVALSVLSPGLVPVLLYYL